MAPFSPAGLILSERGLYLGAGQNEKAGRFIWLYYTSWLIQALLLSNFALAASDNLILFEGRLSHIFQAFPELTTPLILSYH